MDTTKAKVDAYLLNYNPIPIKIAVSTEIYIK